MGHCHLDDETASWLAGQLVWGCSLAPERPGVGATAGRLAIPHAAHPHGPPHSPAEPVWVCMGKQRAAVRLPHAPGGLHGWWARLLDATCLVGFRASKLCVPVHLQHVPSTPACTPPISSIHTRLSLSFSPSVFLSVDPQARPSTSPSAPPHPTPQRRISRRWRTRARRAPAAARRSPTALCASCRCTPPAPTPRGHRRQRAAGRERANAPARRCAGLSECVSWGRAHPSAWGRWGAAGRAGAGVGRRRRTALVLGSMLSV